MAWYKTGTVSVTNGSTTVTGSGTNWIAGANVGEGFQGPDGEIYEITAIGSATSLTLASGYGGSTASGVTYAIVPTHALTASLASSVADLISDYQSVVDNAGAGKFGDGSAAAPAITFTLDQDTGFFRDTANEIAVAIGGTKIGEFNSTGLNMTTAIKADGLETVSGVDIDMDGAASGQLRLDGNGYASAIALNAEGMNLYTNSDVRDVILGTNETQRLRVDGNGSISFYDSAGSSQSLFWDASAESLGIGTTSPSSYGKVAAAVSSKQAGFAVHSSGGAGATTGYVFSSGNYGFLDYDPTSSAGVRLSALNNIRFGINSNAAYGSSTFSEAMRIDSSGNLLVGKTSVEYTSEGLVLRERGEAYITSDGRAPLLVNRLTSDGDIATFRKDGSTVGSIGNSGNYMYSVSYTHLTLPTNREV